MQKKKMKKTNLKMQLLIISIKVIKNKMIQI